MYLADGPLISIYLFVQLLYQRTKVINSDYSIIICNLFLLSYQELFVLPSNLLNQWFSTFFAAVSLWAKDAYNTILLLVLCNTSQSRNSSFEGNTHWLSYWIKIWNADVIECCYVFRHLRKRSLLRIRIMSCLENIEYLQIYEINKKVVQVKVQVNKIA